MTERLMGVETEYAFLAFRKDGSPSDARAAMGHIEALAEQHLAHLPVKGQRGIFLQNASRFYRDYGGSSAHQEMSTPECPNPWDAVRYVVADEQILLGLAARLLREEGELGEALYFKHNVDYSGAGTSWGTHESYLTQTAIEDLPDQLLPHLVSRLIYTGAGGFNPRSPTLEFMLSPRVAHIAQPISIETERFRPIFNLRDEPLCNGGYRRLHVICGESLCSHTGMWLRSATTSLVLALVDGGVNAGEAVTLAEPVVAMRAFAGDPTCRAKAPLQSGQSASAIEIQRHYLNLAEKYLRAEFMPPWAPQVCQHWRAILDRLEQGAPESVAATLDWAIKFSLFSERLTQAGLRWGELNGHADSGPLQKSRQTLFELDIRYGQLGERGIFGALDRAGVLQHQFPGVDNFPHAMANPPNLGRARLRGQAVQKLAETKRQGCCDWDGVWNVSDRQYLNLSNPFEAVERWKPFPALEVAADFPEQCELHLQMIEKRFLEGAFEQASLEIRMMDLLRTPLAAPQVSRLLRLKALVQARRGHLDAVQILNRAHDANALGLEETAEYLYALRCSALAPRPEMREYVHSALNRFGGQQTDSLPASFREHWGAYLVWCGKTAEAETILEGALRSTPPGIHQSHRRRALLGNVKRLLGKVEEARLLLDEARRQQQEMRLLGDLADFTLPGLAKLICRADEQSARAVLAEAKGLQSRNRNRLGHLRTLLLEARLGPAADSAPHLKDAMLTLASQVPSLATCTLFQQIMERWEVWTHDLCSTGDADPFWGL